jgi:hypothetical protein
MGVLKFAGHGWAWRGSARQGKANTQHPMGVLKFAWLGLARRGNAWRRANTQHPVGVLKFAEIKTKTKGKTMENTIENMEVVRLPLWKNCYEEMLRDGVDYGSAYSTEYFEERLKVGRDSMAFGMDISKIRAALLSHGYFLSGRGQKGEQFVVVRAAANAAVMENFQAQAIKALKAGVILGTNTKLDVLTDEERRKHESTLEKLAIRAALVSRKMPLLKKALNSLGS